MQEQLSEPQVISRTGHELGLHVARPRPAPLPDGVVRLGVERRIEFVLEIELGKLASDLPDFGDKPHVAVGDRGAGFLGELVAVDFDGIRVEIGEPTGAEPRPKFL